MPILLMIALDVRIKSYTIQLKMRAYKEKSFVLVDIRSPHCKIWHV